jgi:lysophospholipase L1-like esterase
MKPQIRTALFALIAPLFALAPVKAQSPETFYLNNGDRVVFYGDSITDQRLYTTLAETYVVTRYPQLNATFFHSGWGGDRVSGGGGGPVDLRLQRDVIAYKPNVMTIMLGMNDGLYQPPADATNKIFYAGFEHIVNTVRAALPGIRITAIEPSPYDDVTRPPLFPGGYNAVLINFSHWITDYAKQNSLTVADFNTPMVNMLVKANQADPVNTQKILPDRVHPSMAGHLVMAEQLLKAWNARPVVASVSISESDGAPKLDSAEHAQVSDLSAQGGIRWTELDDALPLPFAEWEKDGNGTLVSLAIRSSDVTAALNEEPLKVTGLTADSYTLQIDGTNIGTFSKAELADGVNLALLDTPMARQAEEVHKLTIEHATIHNDRWRTIQVPLEKYSLSETKSAMDAMDALEAQVVRKQREAAQPKPHTFQLVPAA